MRFLPSTALAAALLVPLGASASAQTTHTVQLFAETFSPSALTIDVGDTVRWNWQVGFHDVQSGAGGIANGIFQSPLMFPPFEYSVTFDQAFLDANPVAGNVYDYFCIVHASSGMIGKVTVDIPPTVSPYGCVNPSGSLTSLSGSPTIGSTWNVGVDNPLGTQPAGSLAFLGIASAPQFGFPCGLPVPGFGMSGPGAAGELLLNIAAPDPFLTLGPTTWTGAPASFPVAFPAQQNFVGITFYFQGLVYDVGGTSGVTLGVTEGLAVTVGS